MAKLKLIILGIMVLVVIVGFYFSNDILKIYRDLGNNLRSFEKIDFNNLISQVKKEIIIPPPLYQGGPENQVVLTKAKIIAQTNIQRYNNGQLPPLLENTTLDEVAKAKADDMFQKQYFEHISPSGVGPGDLATRFGYEYVLEGENLILGNFSSEKELVQAWMDSPGHRANILHDRYTEIGVAIVKGTYKGESTWIGVQEFGLPLSSCPKISVSLKSAIDTNKVQLDQLSKEIDAKRAEIENTNQKSKEYRQLVDEYNKLVGQYNALNQETKNLISQYNIQVSAFNKCVEDN